METLRECSTVLFMETPSGRGSGPLHRGTEACQRREGLIACVASSAARSRTTPGIARRFRTTRPCSGPAVVGAGSNGRQQLTSTSTAESLSSEVMHEVFGASSTTYEVEARCDDNTSIHRASSTKNLGPKRRHHRDRHIDSECTCFAKLRPLSCCGRKCSTPILLVPFEFTSMNCVAELRHGHPFGALPNSSHILMRIRFALSVEVPHPAAAQPGKSLILTLRPPPSVHLPPSSPEQP